MSAFSRISAIVALVAFAPLLASAQDAAAEAQKQLAEIQKQLAGGTELQKRLRIDKFELADQQVKVTGVFLELPPAKADQQPFDDLQTEVGKLLRDRLKDDALKFDWSSIKRIEQKDHPQVLLQLAANASGTDLIKFDGSRFGPDGGLIVYGIRGKDEAVGKWLSAALSANLNKHDAVKLKDGKPLVSDKMEPVDWKLSASEVQKLFAASPDAPTRRLRVDRAYLAYDTENPGTLHVTLTGVRLGDDAVDADAIAALCRKQWPELFAGTTKVLVNLKPLLGPGLTAPPLQAAVAARKALDGVRVDAGAEFGPGGELLLAGLQPGLTPAAEKELAEAYQAVLKELIDKADAASDRYKRLAASGVSTKRMKLVPTGKLLAEMRTWTADNLDDALLSRLYFAADGGLKLQCKTATKADGDKVQAKFKELAAKLLPPEHATEPTTFTASLTAHLRTVMAGDQKKWNGVLIERGFFDADSRYTLRGAVDTAAQQEHFTKLLDELKDDARWVDYFITPIAKPTLDVVPLTELVERVKRVAPAYSVFDGVRIESARYDASGNLIFDAHIVGQIDRDATPLLAKLLRDHPTYKRRAPADRQVQIVRVGGADTTDDQVANFSAAVGAKLLADGDKKKAKVWLDSAMLHYPNEAGVWFLSAYYNHANGDKELVRRDLFRVIELEGPLAFNGSAQRKRRYDSAKILQGTARNQLESLWLEYFREVKDGAKPITMQK